MTANTGAIITGDWHSQLGLTRLRGSTDFAPAAWRWWREKAGRSCTFPGRQIIPNHKIGKYADGIGDGSMSSHSSHTMHNTFHIYESRNGKQTAREVGKSHQIHGTGDTVFSK